MGDGVNVTVGTEVSVGLVVAVFVGVMVGLGVDANAVQLTILAALKITTNTVTKFEMGFDVTFSIIAIMTNLQPKLFRDNSGMAMILPVLDAVFCLR
jgi:hypothetical protein